MELWNYESRAAVEIVSLPLWPLFSQHKTQHCTALLYSDAGALVEAGTMERRLLNDLLQFYNNLERPVYSEQEPVLLKLGLTLQQIIDVVSNKV